MKPTLPWWSVLLLSTLAITSCGLLNSGGTTTNKPIGTITARISSVGAQYDQDYNMAADDSGVWIHNGVQGIVTRIDPHTNTVIATIPVEDGPGQIGIGTDAVWVVSGGNYDTSTVSKIDLHTNKVVDAIHFPPNRFLTVSPAGVWVGSYLRNVVTRIDPYTDQVVATIAINNLPTFLSYGAGTVWTCNHGVNGLNRIDPLTNQVATQIDIGLVDGLQCGGVVAEDDAVWLTPYYGADSQGNDLAPDHLVERVDPATNKVVARITLPADLDKPIAADAHGVWVFDYHKGLFRIDPRTNTYLGMLEIPNAAGVAVGAGSVWCATGDGTVLRIEPTV
jgi:YVTN family beta-propeller protein